MKWIQFRKEDIDRFIAEYNQLKRERVALIKALDELEAKLNKKCLDDEWWGLKELKKLETENAKLKKELKECKESKEKMEKMYLLKIKELIKKIKEVEIGFIPKTNQDSYSPLRKVRKLIRKLDMKI